MRPTRSATAVLEENPYLQQVPETQQRVRARDEHETVSPDVVDEKTAEEYRYENGEKRDGRRRILFPGGLAIILLASFFMATLYYRRNPRRIDYPDRQTTSRSALPTRNDSTTRSDSGTEKAIEEAQVIVGPTTPTANDASPGITTPTSETVAGPGDNPQTGFNASSEFSTTVKTKAPEIWPNVGSGEVDEKQTNTTPPPTQRRNSNAIRSNEASIYANDPRSAAAEVSSQRPATVSSTAETIKVPHFGMMLPVRTLGGFYTLRNRSLVRLELTRDMSGAGWSMKRGTVLVGTSSGADVDRAHVSIIGFIDQSGRFVKVGGDLLGNDGTAGIKGKRRKIDSGWTRMLAKVGTDALNLTSSLLAGRGTGTVIISDGLRARAVNPITEEISGIARSELDQRRGSFVEVTAGTPGYVMITDLPSNKESRPAPAPEGQYLATMTDVDATRPATGLSEHELADLLSTGSTTEIKAALPRMSPEMRRLATAFLDR